MTNFTLSGLILWPESVPRSACMRLGTGYCTQDGLLQINYKATAYLEKLLGSMALFNYRAIPTNITNYNSHNYKGCRTCLTNRVGFISCHIVLLVISSLWAHVRTRTRTYTHTYTHKRTHAHTHTHTHTHTQLPKQE